MKKTHEETRRKIAETIENIVYGYEFERVDWPWPRPERDRGYFPLCEVERMARRDKNNILIIDFYDEKVLSDNTLLARFESITSSRCPERAIGIAVTMSTIVGYRHREELGSDNPVITNMRLMIDIGAVVDRLEKARTLARRIKPFTITVDQYHGWSDEWYNITAEKQTELKVVVKRQRRP